MKSPAWQRRQRNWEAGRGGQEDLIDHSATRKPAAALTTPARHRKPPWRSHRARQTLANGVGLAITLAVITAVLLQMSGTAPDFLRLQLGREARYEYHAEWAAYLAPEDQCPGGEDGEAPAAQQRQTMLCLLNWARKVRGLEPLRPSRKLMRASARKAQVMVKCNEFAHNPCGLRADELARSLRFRGGFGENIAWGTGIAGAPRPTVDGWLSSAGHRRNLFRKRWTVQGMAVLQPDRYRDASDAAVWVSEFGR
jgi:uncharacterized protein YkwD